jgi:two-component system alkaline phosphatase synthesis response regulator PhoP
MPPKKALVVEDNRVMASVLTFNLRKAGFDVKTAFNGLEGVGFLAAEQFDVVLTDYQMPHMGGEELCRRIRADERHVDVPIFLISAKRYELDATRIQEDLRLSGILEKPFSPKDVVARVQEAVAAAPV